MLRRPAVALVFGALLLTGAVTGFIIVPEHKPVPAGTRVDVGGFMFTTDHAAGLSQPVYDALRIGTWALLIAGVLLAAVGLINYARRS